MIHLMGLTVRGKDNPDGDVEIEYTGLRPAEKLYEELLIGTDVMGTAHPRIMRAHEDFMPWSALRPILERLWDACEQLDYEKARTTLLEAVAGYAPTEGVGDLVWQERNRNLARKAVIGNVTPLESRRGTSSGEQRGT
jgi:FlaA1/EpsC-like NDP-sugar epimerase